MASTPSTTRTRRGPLQPTPTSTDPLFMRYEMPDKTGALVDVKPGETITKLGRECVEFLNAQGIDWRWAPVNHEENGGFIYNGGIAAQECSWSKHMVKTKQPVEILFDPMGMIYYNAMLPDGQVDMSDIIVGASIVC